MAVPWINVLAPSMGGIGPIEGTDRRKVDLLTAKSGVPFYAGRFYPKGNKSIIDDLFDGIFQNDTPPWLGWEEIQPSQIWMVPVFEDERVVTTETSIERIDLWPREPDDPDVGIPDFDDTTIRHTEAVKDGWGQVSPGAGTNVQNDSIDPGIIVKNNLIPPALFAGYVGISEISGRVSEYGFYDTELHLVNHKSYGQEHLITDDYEMVRIREDGAWIRRSAELPRGADGQLIFIDDNEEGYPNESGVNGWSRSEYPAENYQNWVMSSDYDEARTFGNDYWNFFTRWIGDNPKAGLVAMRPSRLDTIVFTIKVSCTTINVPDPMPGETALTLQDYARSGFESFGSNLTNNIWYFYWPVRYNGDLASQRFDYHLKRAGINKLDNPDYLPPSSVS